MYLTNTANTRVFRVRLPGARMKLVGGDSGRHEVEEFVEHVTLAPSERVVVDLLFDEPGEFTLEHVTPERIYGSPRSPSPRMQHAPLLQQVEELRRDPELTAERARLAADLTEPDKRLAFIAEMDMGAPEGEGPVVYMCPMHPEVMSEEPGIAPSAA